MNISLSSIVNEAPIVAIVRRPKVDPVRCIEHLFQHGIRLVEITMDSELRGPFAQIPLMASGGVNLENAPEFIKFGVGALGLGGGLIPKSNDEFEQCAALAHQLLEVALKARDSR
jgi:2-keto-3-deoxy-6-phosphogluconate aldolase